MRFEGRDLAVGAEHVAASELRVHETYFIVEFNDGSMLIPSLRPVVFVGRNLLNGDLDKLYFQDYESFSAGRRHDLTQVPDGVALKVPLAVLKEGKANVRSALNRASRKSGHTVATASDDTFLYVWNEVDQRPRQTALSRL